MSNLYAAYGSNISERQMRKRVGRNAQKVGKAWLVDYRLVFRGMKNKAVANIEPAEGGRVPIYLWRLNETAEDILDRYEGVANHCYRQETVRVEYGGIWLDDVMVYVMVPGKSLNSPSEQYYQTIVEGYLMQRMPLQILEEARDRSTKK